MQRIDCTLNDGLNKGWMHSGGCGTVDLARIWGHGRGGGGGDAAVCAGAFLAATGRFIRHHADGIMLLLLVVGISTGAIREEAVAQLLLP